jgi:hypothetical protein
MGHPSCVDAAAQVSQQRQASQVEYTETRPQCLEKNLSQKGQGRFLLEAQGLNSQ